MKLHEKNKVREIGLLNDQRLASPLRPVDQAMTRPQPLPDGASRWWRRMMTMGAMAALLAPGFVSAQLLLQPDFVVNTTTAGNQREPDIATDPAGNFTIVWTGPDGDGDGVFARRFSADGTPLGAEFRVNTVIVGAQSAPAVATDAQGRFVVVYAAPDADGNGIYARRYAASGSALDAAPFRVNVGTAGRQVAPDVAAAPDGATVIAWSEVFPAEDYLTRVSFRLFAANGRPTTGDVVADTEVSFEGLSRVSVAMQTDGSFVIAYENSTRGDETGAMETAGFSATGALLKNSDEQQYHSLHGKFSPSIATAGSGYVLASDDAVLDLYEDVAYVHRLDAQGAPLGSVLALNDPRRNNSEGTSVGGTPSGQFTVVAQASRAEFTPMLSGSIYGRRYSAGNLPLSAATPFDTPATGIRYAPVISLAANGNGIVVWTDGLLGGYHGLDGDLGGIVARRFAVSP